MFYMFICICDGLIPTSSQIPILPFTHTLLPGDGVINNDHKHTWFKIRNIKWEKQSHFWKQKKIRFLSLYSTSRKISSHLTQHMDVLPGRQTPWSQIFTSFLPWPEYNITQNGPPHCSVWVSCLGYVDSQPLTHRQPSERMQWKGPEVRVILK